jgi:uncharacterized membrane protein
MTLSNLMKLLHILAGFGLMTGAIGRNITFRRAGEATDVGAVRALLEASEFFERRMLIPSSMAVLLFGLVTAWLQGWPILGFLQGGNSNWLLVSLILYLVPGFVIPGFLIPRRRQRQSALDQALAQGRITPELSAALHDKYVAGFRTVELVGLGLILILMVLKPF